jgi:hypothetical protein
MIASILIVGEDEMLSHTRALLLDGGDWTTGTMNPSSDTTEPIEVRPYDLLIICHTVSDDRARELIARAAVVSPNVKVLAIARPGNGRKVESANRVIETVDPAIFIQAVKTLLN